MAYEICSLSSSRTIGGGVSSVAKCGIITDSLSSRKSRSLPLSVDFRSGKLCKGTQGRLQLVCDRSLRTKGMSVHASHEEHGFYGALTTTEKPYSQIPPGNNGSSILEKWLESSLTEIVRHLPEAPFLQYVSKSSNHDGGADLQKVSEELFDKPENWGSVKQCLLESAPDGIILVHRLDPDALSECSMNEDSGIEDSPRSGFSLQAGNYSTDVWGVLVHGCSMQCNACYILKTTRVANSSGILTHFCISRAKCFGPSLKSQLQNTWLL